MRIRAVLPDAFAATRESVVYMSGLALQQAARKGIEMGRLVLAAEEGLRALMKSTCCFLLQFWVTSLAQVAHGFLERRSEDRQ